MQLLCSHFPKKNNLHICSFLQKVCFSNYVTQLDVVFHAMSNLREGRVDNNVITVRLSGSWMRIGVVLFFLLTVSEMSCLTF